MLTGASLATTMTWASSVRSSWYASRRPDAPGGLQRRLLRLRLSQRDEPAAAARPIEQAAEIGLDHAQSASVELDGSSSPTAVPAAAWNTSMPPVDRSAPLCS